MGKTTNAMEAIVSALYDKNFDLFCELVEDRKSFHIEIMDALFEDKKNPIFEEVNTLFEDLKLMKKDRLVENRSEEHTSELQSRPHLVCRLLLEKKKKKKKRKIDKSRVKSFKI